MKSQTIISYDYNDKVNERIIILKRCWVGEVEKYQTVKVSIKLQLYTDKSH